MANIKISDLTAAGAASGTMEFEVNDSLSSKKVTGTQVADFVLSTLDSTDISGAGGLLAANNLSDVTAATARTNLGLGSAALYNTTALPNLTVDTNTLHVDATNNRVGVGTTSPGTAFEVVGATTLDAVTFGAEVVETVYAVSGTTPALDPANGTIQTWTLSGNSTPTDSLSAGESITLMIDDGTAYTITWPTITWVNNAGAAPTLATSGYTVVALWKVSTTLYGALVGDGS